VKSHTHSALGRLALTCRLNRSNSHGDDASGVAGRTRWPRSAPAGSSSPIGVPTAQRPPPARLRGASAALAPRMECLGYTADLRDKRFDAGPRQWVLTPVLVHRANGRFTHLWENGWFYCRSWPRLLRVWRSHGRSNPGPSPRWWLRQHAAAQPTRSDRRPQDKMASLARSGKRLWPGEAGNCCFIDTLNFQRTRQ
jgi:hypothetical protein